MDKRDIFLLIMGFGVGISIIAIVAYMKKENRILDEKIIELNKKVFLLEDNFLAFNSGTNRLYNETPIMIPSLAVVKCTAFASVGGADVQTSWFGILVPNPN